MPTTKQQLQTAERAQRTLTRHLAPAHHYLRRRYPTYNWWHDQPYARHVHWVVLVLAIIVNVGLIHRAALGAGFGGGLPEGEVPTPPTVASVTTPAHGLAYRSATLPTLTGQAADGSTGLGLLADSTTFRLERLSDGLYWSGSGWGLATNLSTTHPSTLPGETTVWTPMVTLPVWTDDVYRLTALVTNQMGQNLTSAAVTFTYDATAPTAPIITLTSPSDDSTPSFSWPAVTDTTGITSLILQIGRTAGTADVIAANLSVSATSYSLNETLAPGTYYVGLLATDGAGNQTTSNAVEFSIVAPTVSETPTASPTPSATASPTPSVSPTPAPAITPTPSPIPGSTSSPTPSASLTASSPTPSVSPPLIATETPVTSETALLTEAVTPTLESTRLVSLPPVQSNLTPIPPSPHSSPPELSPVAVVQSSAPASQPSREPETLVAGRRLLGDGLASISLVLGLPLVEAFTKVIYGSTVAVVSLSLFLKPLFNLSLLFPIDRLRAWLFSALADRRRWKRKGRVVDAESSLPIPLARVRAYRAGQPHFLEEQSTDRNGYFFEPNQPGPYRLQVDKHGYSFPSNLSRNGYHGEDLPAFDQPIDIFLDPDPHRLRSQLLIPLGVQSLVGALRRPLLFVGSALAVTDFLASGRLISGLILASYLLIWAEFSLEFRLQRLLQGRVIDHKTNQPIALVIIRFVSEVTQALTITAVSNKKGEFTVLLPPGYYQVRLTGLGYKQLLIDEQVLVRGEVSAKEYRLHRQAPASERSKRSA